MICYKNFLNDLLINYFSLFQEFICSVINLYLKTNNTFLFLFAMNLNFINPIGSTIITTSENLLYQFGLNVDSLKSIEKFNS